MLKQGRVLEVVAAEYGVTVEALKSTERGALSDEAKAMAAILLRVHYPPIGYMEISRLLGRDHHTSARHAVKSAIDRMATSKTFRERFRLLEKKLGAKQSKVKEVQEAHHAD